MALAQLARSPTDKRFLVLFFKKEHSFFLGARMSIIARLMDKPAVPFAVACCVLATLAAAEWLPAGEVAAPRPLTVAQIHTADDPGGDTDRDTAGWASTITARPLFNIGRRPPKSASHSNAVASSDLPRLSGIMITPGGRRAIFSPESGKPLVLAEGAALEDGTIRRIAADSVTIQSAKGDMVLRPSFDHNHAAGTPIINGPAFPPNAAAFNPAFPNPAFAPGMPQVPQPAPDQSDDANNADGAPAQPIPRPPFPGAFRNPAQLHVRPQ
jgi:hypothetical protein